MCSVVGCESGRRGAQRLKLPEDPERRLEWVQFLATVNKQRFKESSWTDITICIEHFTDECFENLTPSHSGKTGKVQLTLKPSAVPSLCLQSESDEPEPDLESPKCVEPEETRGAACQCDQLKTCDGPTSYSEESRRTSMVAQGTPVPQGVPSSTDTSHAVVSVHGRMHPKNKKMDLIREKAALLQMKGKYVVNEKRLLQLFSCKCPLCGCKLQMEKVTYGVFVVLNQRCLQCEYRNHWKSQVNASVPTAAEQHLTVGTEVTPETQQAAPKDGVPEIVAVVDEESDSMDEEELSEQGDMDSDEDWKPVRGFFPARVLQKKPDNETEDDGEEEEEGEHDNYSHFAPKHRELCTDCGMFFNKRWPHTCEHKMKPYPCNICGKRCVSEVALIRHSRVHDANYEHRCKYCHVTFKTKVDKFSHEQTHLTEGKPYKCPDCSETFASNKERRIHLVDHRGPPQLKCDICGMEFLWPLTLQRHLSVHTGEKPFKCSVCQRGFNQAGHLKSHMRLHTGERPYKCQHCDKCFNHNVSLKSHVQRYHTPSSGCEQKKEKINERESDTVDAQDNGNKSGADLGLDNVEEEQDTEEEGQNERIYGTTKKRKTTGRPIGRPKSYESGNSVMAVKEEGQCSNTKTGKPQGQKLKKTRASDEESGDEPGDSDKSFETSEEGEERSEKVASSTSRPRRKAKNSDSDSDFDPAESKKKRHSSQNSGKGLGKRRGRPRKKI
ncbi:zinc finger protein 64-like [Micropterus dolomieu]|uniref:zinc finger protein 64-like n=1 Tax=Micropterus dolomieu TaxID=147949 RepID=UPI001E8DBEF7|nr:zinc finger protein 64-like [Micropterus dolomieu]